MGKRKGVLVKDRVFFFERKIFKSPIDTPCYRRNSTYSGTHLYFFRSLDGRRKKLFKTAREVFKPCSAIDKEIYGLIPEKARLQSHSYPNGAVNEKGKTRSMIPANLAKAKRSLAVQICIEEIGFAQCPH